MNKRSIFLALCCTVVFGPSARSQSNNAALKGDYAFSYNGMTTGDGSNFTPFAAVGRFTADGAGNLTIGEVDTNGVGLPEKLVAQAFTGTYAIGGDNRGVMNLNIPGGGTLAFVMMANGNAKFVEIDAAGGHGTVGSGIMEKADTTAYRTARITGDYAFGAAGLDDLGKRAAMAGRLTANGMGVFSSGAADVNEAGMFTTSNAFAAAYNVTDSTSGRGMIVLPPLIGGALQNLNFVFYVANAGKLFAMETDEVTPATPLLNGVVLQQQTPAIAGFSSGALNGGMVIYGSGAGCSEGGLITADGLATLTLTYDTGCTGESAAAGASGTYTVASNGRTAIRIGSAYVVAYLVSTNEAFYLVPDAAVSFGFGEPQAAGALTNSSVSGTYAGATTASATLNGIFSGEFTADGAIPTGNLTGTEDIGAPSGPTVGAAAAATYSISSPAANGRGTITGNIGQNGIVYVISRAKFVVVSFGNEPAILVFEQ